MNKSYLQNTNCVSLPSNIKRCIECHSIQKMKKMKKKSIKSVNDNDILCRFNQFRILKPNKSGKLNVFGFPNPFSSPTDSELEIWLPDENLPTSSSFDKEVSRKILEEIGGQFCQLVNDEKNILHLSLLNNRQKKPRILWKKYINGIREICDVCKTSIFNNHGSCRKCGFIVCIDCYRTELNDIQLTSKICSSPNSYIKKKWLLCTDERNHSVNQLSITQMVAGDVINYIYKHMNSVCKKDNINIYDCRLYGVSTNLAIDEDHIYRNPTSSNSRQDFYSRTSETREIQNKKIYSSIPKENIHMWLCDGHLLRLLDPKHKNNLKLFQKQWKCGQPVLVSNVAKHLNSTLWDPLSFSRDFGHLRNDIIDCNTGKVFKSHRMYTFWNGFENSDERLCNKEGKPMLLKLKDWPPLEDFAEVLPDRFQDFMNCLPLEEYTHRNGKFNLASYLPEYFVRPDLGPKMYTAYGNIETQYDKIGTTCLHLDMTDAINVMVHITITKKGNNNNYDRYVRKAMEVIEKAGCDDLTMERIHKHNETPGALWHIYDVSDTAAIRELLIKVDNECGKFVEEFCDPIHDQSHYLDEYLRERLLKEYNIRGYTILQFYGDAIFIPAGAPHQVRNLHNCIKIAEDFVSPENVDHSFRLTQEFRNLTEDHTNHEDKLQIKNIVFHAVKDSISVLSRG